MGIFFWGYAYIVVAFWGYTYLFVAGRMDFREVGRRSPITKEAEGALIGKEGLRLLATKKEPNNTFLAIY